MSVEIGIHTAHRAVRTRLFFDKLVASLEQLLPNGRLVRVSPDWALERDMTERGFRCSVSLEDADVALSSLAMGDHGAPDEGTWLYLEPNVRCASSYSMMLACVAVLLDVLGPSEMDWDGWSFSPPFRSSSEIFAYLAQPQET